MEMAEDYATLLLSKSPLEAFHESVAKARAQQLDPEMEPRLKTKKLSQPLSAEHPFFSAANLLVAVPTQPARDAAADADPQLPADIDPGQALDPAGDPAANMKQDQGDGGDSGKKDAGGQSDKTKTGADAGSGGGEEAGAGPGSGGGKEEGKKEEGANEGAGKGDGKKGDGKKGDSGKSGSGDKSGGGG